MLPLWLVSRRFDLGFFVLPAAFALLMLVPYAAFGPVAIIPIYVSYMVFFGLPHNYLTWAAILPESPRKSMRMPAIYAASAISLFFCILIPATDGERASDWILTALGILATWHLYRQHFGICRLYDFVQQKRTGDRGIGESRRPLELFLGLALFGTLVWMFQLPEVEFRLSPDEHYWLIHPVVPHWLFQTYLAVTLLAGAYGLKRAIYDRWRDGRLIPWPQLLVTFAAVASFWVPYFFIPMSAMPLGAAIATGFHNIQYFGFVWMYERHRTAELESAGEKLQLPQRLARAGSWRGYFALALGFSALVMAVYGVAPRNAGRVLLYFMAASHYLVDGFIWKRTMNAALVPAFNRLAGEPSRVRWPW